MRKNLLWKWEVTTTDQVFVIVIVFTLQWLIVAFVVNCVAFLTTADTYTSQSSEKKGFFFFQDIILCEQDITYVICTNNRYNNNLCAQDILCKIFSANEIICAFKIFTSTIIRACANRIINSLSCTNITSACKISLVNKILLISQYQHLVYKIITCA